MAGEGASTPSSCAGLAAVFVKGGAEGVHCAALPGLGIGIAVKVDDGAKRGAETVLDHLLAKLVAGADRVLAGELAGESRNWHGDRAGTVGPRRPSRLRSARFPAKVRLLRRRH